ncbi:nucleotide exchange factor GrpE [Nitrosarchaeum koreense]|uniref:Protein GrpE n=1 Tax=Nitrosarchaeum koreense MY1 TaxID=1001994 RepID=F9CXP3_9ARCH|nr:Protein grpE [Nitrosarchaeum koreense MY1]
MVEMSDKNNPDEVPVNVISKNKINNLSEDLTETISDNVTVDELQNLLEIEKQKVKDYEDKIKHVLADYQNLNKKTQSDIEKGVNTKIEEFMLDFLKIYDDFIRAKQVFSESKINTNGLDSILKNMDSLLSKYNITPIDALGEIFDPNLHEAISIIEDSELDNNTIVKELRKGYISHKRVIRPTLVEISKNNGEIK